MRNVRFTAQSPNIDITVSMGDGPATLTGGIGGWKTVERVDDIDFSTWEGQTSLTQDVPLLLDGWGHNATSVERELNTLFKLGRDFNHNSRGAPPVFQVEGPVFYPGKFWVLPENGIDLNSDDTIRLGDGTLVRQSLTMHLLEYVDPIALGEHRKKSKQLAGGGGKRLGDRYVTKQGDTLIKVAAAKYGRWETWKAIKDANDLTIGAETVMPAGTHLILP